METLIDRLIERYTKVQNLEADQIAYVKYGLEVVVTTVINVVLIMLLATLLHKPSYGLLFMIVFVPTRAVSGGYHSTTRLRCNILILFCEMIVLFMPDLLTQQRTAAAVILVEGFVYELIVYRYAPVENHRKPLAIEIQKKNKKASRILGMVWGILLVFLCTYRIQIAVSIATTLLIVAILMCLGVHKEKIIDDSDCGM